MDPAEYAIMYHVEDTHWWYKGMEQITRAVVQRWYAPGTGLRILDAGCGTGAVMGYLTDYGQVTGFDFAAEALSFVHLWGTPPPTEGGRIWGQEDAQPCDNSYPYAWWVPGDMVVEERWIQVPPETPPGEYHLVVGMYQDNQPRLPITDAAGQPLGDFWILTPVTIAPVP